MFHRDFVAHMIIALVLCAGSVAGQGRISIDVVEGTTTSGLLEYDVKVRFLLRITNDSENSIDGMANGFRVFSPDGARWNTTSIDTLGTIGAEYFDGGIIFNHFSITGSGADTVGFAAYRIYREGLPVGFDDTVLSITIGPIDPHYPCRHICVDSCFYPPSGVWMWALPCSFPAWEGPYCFAAPCYNVNANDGSGDDCILRIGYPLE